jgi:hypothetical protein
VWRYVGQPFMYSAPQRITMVDAPVCHHTGISGWTSDDHFLLHIGLVVGLFGARAHLTLVIAHFFFHCGSEEINSSAGSKHACIVISHPMGPTRST